MLTNGSRSKEYVEKSHLLVFQFHSTLSIDSNGFGIVLERDSHRCQVGLRCLSHDAIFACRSRDHPPLIKLESRLFGTVDKIPFEFLRLSLPIICQDRFTPR